MPPHTAYAFGPYLLHPAERLLLNGDTPVRLGARAFDILCVLIRSGGKMLSKEELLNSVWGSTVVDDGNVRVHIAALRKALGDDATRQTYIASAPVLGYRFVAPVQARTPEGSPAASSSPAAVHPPTAPARDDSLRGVSTRLHGRDDAIATIASLLDEHRLVTVVGPGGMGKTSVALAVAARLNRSLPHGACFVDLSSLVEPALVPSALAAALGVPLLSGDAVPRIVSHLDGRSLLIVIDNCEHVVTAVADLVERLLRRLPQVRLLATSREPLGAQGEWIQRLKGLETPWQDAPLSAADALAFPSVQMLVEHIAASVDTFELAETDVDAAVRICRAMDGIPLALELVATRVPSFGLQQLARLLTERVSLLGHGRRTSVARHQTLHAALDWSHALLEGRERAVLRRLAMFRGEFTIQAAAALCECPEIDAGVAAECLVQLVNKSLVAMDGATARGTPGYRLLETTRDFAQARLTESGEAAAVARRHAQVVCDALDAATGRQGIDDVRAAMDWAFSPGADLSLGIRLTLASAPLWFALGLLSEFRDRLDQAEHARTLLAPDPARDLQLALVTGHAYMQTLGPTPTSGQCFERAAVLARQVGDATDRLNTLWSLYSDRMVRGDYAGMLDLAREFGATCEASGEDDALPTHHRMMAMSQHMTGDHAEALAHAVLARQAPLARAPFLDGTAYQVDHLTSTMVPMARVLWIQGRTDEAAAVIAEAVDRATAMDLGYSASYMLALAACPIALWNGDRAQAQLHTRLLNDFATRHTLPFWQESAAMYENVLAWAPDDATGATPDWLERFSKHGGRADLLGTFAPGLLSDHALRRMQSGHTPWCAVELRRSETEREWRATRLATTQAAETLLDIATLARRQGAVSWELRATLTLAECLHALHRTAEAVVRLETLMARLPPGRAQGDAMRATRLLASLGKVRG